MTFMILLAAVNLPLRGRFRHALSQGEMVVIYAILSVGTAMAAEWASITNQYIHSYAAFQDQNQQYREQILPHLPRLLYFGKEEGPLLQDYITGGHEFWYFLSKLHLWARPLFGWTLVFGLTMGAMLCINTLMREQWTANEKLSFPIIQLPTLLTQSPSEAPIWRSRFLWAGFAVMAAIDTLNALNWMYPGVPRINVRYLADVGAWFPSPPWNGIGWTPIAIFPYMSALGLFMPTDLLFSVIFFFVCRKILQVFMVTLGYEQGVFGGGGLVPAPPYFSEQTWGAFLGLFVMAVWVSRHYLREIGRQIVRGSPPGYGGITPRWSFVGLILSIGGLVGFSAYIGLPVLLMIVYLALFMAFSIALTRMRAQLGPPTHEMAFMGPNQMIVNFAGTRAVPESWIVKIANVFLYQNRLHRTHPMPSQLEGIKMGADSRLNQKTLFWVILLATIVGSMIGNMMYIALGYQLGAGGNWGDATLIISQLGTTRRDPNPMAMLMVIFGFSVVMALDFIRFRVPAFPLHPVGYALSMNFGVDYYWFGLLIVWLIKVFVQRYYGLKGYEKLRAVALGVLLAEFSAETILGGLSVITHTAMYTISINGRLHWQQ